jgi:hypothetical protein
VPTLSLIAFANIGLFAYFCCLSVLCDSDYATGTAGVDGGIASTSKAIAAQRDKLLIHCRACYVQAVAACPHNLVWKVRAAFFIEPLFYITVTLLDRWPTVGKAELNIFPCNYQRACFRTKNAAVSVPVAYVGTVLAVCTAIDCL